MTEILRTDLKPVDCRTRSIRPTGFSRLNPRLGCSRAWQEVERIGLSSDEDDAIPITDEAGRIFCEIKRKYKNYTGKVLLKIRGNGIRDRIFYCETSTQDRSISEYHRKKFRHEVCKSIKSQFPSCGEYFNLMLHYNCGVMSKLEIDDTTKP